MITRDLQFNMYCKQWEWGGRGGITHIQKLFWLCYRSDKETWKQQQCLKQQNHMTVILSEVAVSKTGISCLINTKFMMLLGADGFIYWQGQDTFLKYAQTK